MKRWYLLVNPKAGKGHAGALAAAAARSLTAQGQSVVVTNVVDLLDSSSSGDSVIACGGDGTVHLALQSCMRQGLNLGILPAGNGNDIARAFGITGLGVEQLVARWLRPPTQIDVGHIAPFGRWFLAVVSTGFDSRVNQRANEQAGSTRYVRAMLAELRSLKPISYRAKIDDRDIDREAFLVCIGNGSTYGAGMRICPDADLRDGQLDITWVSPMARARFLALFPSVYRGHHADRAEVELSRGTRVRVAAPGQLAFADGEHIGELPIDVTLRASALGAYPAWP